MDSNSIQKILVIIVSRIGDTLLTTPAIKSISKHFKDAEITVLAHPNRYEILKSLPFVNIVGSISKKTVFWRGRFAMTYDMAFVYGYDSSLVSYALRVSKRVIAFKQNDKSINLKLYKSVVLTDEQKKTSVDSMMALPQSIGISIATRRLLFNVSEYESRIAEETIHKKGLEGKFLIGIQAVSFPTKAYRDWPTECFLELCKKIIDKNPNVHFLIYGSRAEKEKEKLDFLINGLSGYATSFIGMSLRKTAAVMSKTCLYIGVDTGPTHIMSAFDIPMIVLYHCSYSSNNVGTKGHPCLYAIDHPDFDECSEKSNMSDISVEDVINIVDVIL
jgi:heptosyltransferase-3